MISFYDSGIGGLTILTEVIKLSPQIDFQYFADYKSLPISTKSPQEIKDRLKVVCEFLFQNSDLVIIACNTASVNAVRELQQNWLPQHFPTKQILGISRPILELMQQKYSEFKTQKVSIISTPSTHYSRFYQNEIALLGFLNIESRGLFGLASSIEIDNQAREREILLKISNNPDLILLACTHFPLAKDIISELFSAATIVDPSPFIATQVIKYLHHHPEYNCNSQNNQSYLCSDNVSKFENNTRRFFGINIKPKLIQI